MSFSASRNKASGNFDLHTFFQTLILIDCEQIKDVLKRMSLSAKCSLHLTLYMNE
jgi:hypothetical protein